MDGCPMVQNAVRSDNNIGVIGAAPLPWPAQTRWLEEILATIGEFGSASLGLIAWEVSLDESELVPAWEEALRAGLIERTHPCPATNEDMCCLAGHPAPPLDRSPPP